jgi:hypothetical protein
MKRGLLPLAVVLLICMHMPNLQLDSGMEKGSDASAAAYTLAAPRVPGRITILNRSAVEQPGFIESWCCGTRILSKKRQFSTGQFSS